MQYSSQKKLKISELLEIIYPHRYAYANKEVKVSGSDGLKKNIQLVRQLFLSRARLHSITW